VAVGVLALTAGILVAGAPGPWQRTHAAVQGVGVGGPSDVFTPAGLTVTAGDSVTWTWHGGEHSVTSAGAEPFDSGSLSAGSFSHTFATAGTFSYLCIWHPGMTGSITVLAAVGTPAAPAVGTPAAPAAGTTPGASTPGTVGAPESGAGVLIARAGRPRLASVSVSGGRLRFRLSESATVVALAFRPNFARAVRIGRVVASPGAGTLDLRFDRLHPARYRLVVRATDTGGERSKATRLGYLLTHRVWQRAIDARRTIAKAAPAAAPAAPAATAPIAPIAPIAPPAVAPVVTGAGGVPPSSSDDDGDHADDGGSNGSSGSHSSGSS
jgi:plastocyanin